MEAKARAVRAAVCFALALLAVTSSARSDDAKRVVIGEVATRVPRAKIVWPKALRRALERELAALDVVAQGSAKQFVLSASLVKLEARKTGPGVACTVSAVLREQKSGAIRAVITGRAEAEFEGEDAELGAIEGAVRGAVASVPAAIR
jgi:hypothetical protein